MTDFARSIYTIIALIGLLEILQLMKGVRNNFIIVINGQIYGRTCGRFRGWTLYLKYLP
jgi:hypothetical protein